MGKSTGNIDPKYLKHKLAEHEDRSRRNNLSIDSVAEENKEMQGTCEKKVQEKLNRRQRVGKGKQCWKSEPTKNSCVKINLLQRQGAYIMQYQQIERVEQIHKRSLRQSNNNLRKELWKQVK